MDLIKILDQKVTKGFFKRRHNIKFVYCDKEYEIEVVANEGKVESTYESMTTLQHEYLDLPREIIEDHFNQIKAYIESVEIEDQEN